jgi:hypothetical protein
MCMQQNKNTQRVIVFRLKFEESKKKTEAINERRYIVLGIFGIWCFTFLILQKSINRVRPSFKHRNPLKLKAFLLLLAVDKHRYR